MMKPKDMTRSLGLDLGDLTLQLDAKGRELCCICRTSNDPNHLCERHRLEFRNSEKKKFFKGINRCKPPGQNVW